MCHCNKLDFDLSIISMGILPQFGELLNSDEEKIIADTLKALELPLELSATKRK
jgi:hypothetical protein